MNLTSRLLPVGVALVASMTACHSQQFATVTIYESPSHFVRLEADPQVGDDHGHSHPVDISMKEMEAVLSGLRIQEPPKWRNWFADSDEPSRHRAFTEAEVRFFAPLMARGLKQATPEEVVTFYQTLQDTAIIRKVTSGGIYVQGDQLHIVMGNYRASTHYTADPGVADTEDDRLTPMKSIAPQVQQLAFEPAAAVAPKERKGFSSLFVNEPREVVVRFRQLLLDQRPAPFADR